MGVPAPVAMCIFIWVMSVMSTRGVGFAVVPASRICSVASTLPSNPAAAASMRRRSKGTHAARSGHALLAAFATSAAFLRHPRKRDAKRSKRVAMECVGGLAGLAASMGTMLVADYAGKYLLGKSAQLLMAKMGEHAAAGTIAQVAAAAKNGQRWAQSAGKLMTQARFMRGGWTVTKILGTTACFPPHTTVNRIAHGKAELVEVADLRVGDSVLTLDANLEAVWTDVHAVVAHSGHDHELVCCTVAGQHGSKSMSVTRNHKLVAQRGGRLVTVCAGDLCAGEKLVMGDARQTSAVQSLTSSCSSCVYEVETGAGTVIANGFMVMAANTDSVSGLALSEEPSLIGEPLGVLA
ncbi:unnamed protein product [Symbiodinium natans]|uniref:Hint domain-containing protein n=1 Tax=Symbiodinium natans TaxID=878477 RepID=A0A812LRY2_9DINO|nr:unnamed protein product [Symbiodinium natans]